MINTVSLVTLNDFKKGNVGQLSNSCDKEKLSIAIQEAQDFDLRELFCGWWDDFEIIFKGRDFNIDFNDDFNSFSLLFKDSVKSLDPVEQSVLFDSLMNGGTYTSCNGKTKAHFGIKRIVCYYAYSRYLLLNGFNDTPSGMVQKTNSFSIPKPLKEIESFSNKYRNMGLESFKRTLDFLCHHSEEFSFGHKECGVCECASGCGTKTNTKGFGFRTSVIRR